MATKTKPDGFRTPPQNSDAERALLGAIMLTASIINEIVDMVTPESFYVDKHGIIFRAMLDIYTKSEPIDLISLSTLLETRKQLEIAGGRSYLAQLVNEVPASANAQHYARIVQKNAILRSLIGAGQHISELGFNNTEKEVEEVLDEAEREVFKITNGKTEKKFTTLKKTLTETWEQIERLQESGGGLRGVPSGYPHLDEKLAGFQPSDLIILAARPSVGKTTLALDFARHAAIHGNVPVAIFSLEMSANQLAQRMLAAHAQVNSWNLRTGKLTNEDEFGRLGHALDELSRAPIFIDDQAGNSLVRMRSIARKMKAEHNIGLVIIDYLQLITTTKNYDNMVNQVTEISRSLKALARELNAPVIALSQLSRAVESRGGKPRLSDLRDSGSIEQDADVVMFIHREDRTGNRVGNESDGMAEIIIEKHRNGPVGKIDLFFDDRTSCFLPIDTHHAPMQAEKAFDAF